VVFYLTPRPPLQKERGRRGSWDLLIFGLDSSLLHQKANPMNFRFILFPVMDANEFGIIKTAGLPVGGSAVVFCLTPPDSSPKREGEARLLGFVDFWVRLLASASKS